MWRPGFLIKQAFSTRVMELWALMKRALPCCMYFSSKLGTNPAHNFLIYLKRISKGMCIFSICKWFSFCLDCNWYVCSFWCSCTLICCCWTQTKDSRDILKHKIKSPYLFAKFFVYKHRIMQKNTKSRITRKKKNYVLFLKILLVVFRTSVSI